MRNLFRRGIIAAFIAPLFAIGLMASPALAAQEPPQAHKVNYHCYDIYGSGGHFYGAFYWSRWSPGWISIDRVDMLGMYTPSNLHVNYTYARVYVQDGDGNIVRNEVREGVFSTLYLAWAQKGMYAPAGHHGRITVQGVNNMGSPYSTNVTCVIYVWYP